MYTRIRAREKKKKGKKRAVAAEAAVIQVAAPPPSATKIPLQAPNNFPRGHSRRPAKGLATADGQPTLFLPPDALPCGEAGGRLEEELPRSIPQETRLRPPVSHAGASPAGRPARDVQRTYACPAAS